jgi:uncharacterized protein YjbJ (UPF0337 family)
MAIIVHTSTGRYEHMNWDQIEGKWKQMKGAVREQWGKLTDDDVDVIGGKKDALVGKIQERYGISREEAERQADQWYKTQFETTPR